MKRSLFLISGLLLLHINAWTWSLASLWDFPEEDTISFEEEQAVCYPKQIGALAAAEWRNTATLSSFISESKQSILRDDCCFVHFNSLEERAAWISPFALYSTCDMSIGEKKEKKIDVHQTTYGMKGGFETSVLDPLTVGVGGGYFYSHLDGFEDDGKGHSNTLFLGPYLAYLFPKGILSFTIFGTGNFYGGTLRSCSQKKLELDHTSWNLNARLEGGFDIEIPKTLSIHPQLQLDYLNVFEKSFNNVKSRHSSFFCSLLSVDIAKTIIWCNQKASLKPLLSIGWTLWAPLTSDSVKVKNQTPVSVKTDCKNQLFLGGKLLLLKEKGFLLGIGYEAFIGAKSPIQSGEIRAEWNW